MIGVGLTLGRVLLSSRHIHFTTKSDKPAETIDIRLVYDFGTWLNSLPQIVAHPFAYQFLLPKLARSPNRGRIFVRYLCTMTNCSMKRCNPPLSLYSSEIYEIGLR